MKFCVTNNTKQTHAAHKAKENTPNQKGERVPGRKGVFAPCVRVFNQSINHHPVYVCGPFGSCFGCVLWLGHLLAFVSCPGFSQHV